MDCFLCFTPLKDDQDIICVGPMELPVHSGCYQDDDDE